jgi:NAD/NADP transhydrogenase beta subunit
MGAAAVVEYQRDAASPNPELPHGSDFLFVFFFILSPIIGLGGAILGCLGIPITLRSLREKQTQNAWPVLAATIAIALTTYFILRWLVAGVMLCAGVAIAATIAYLVAMKVYAKNLPDVVPSACASCGYDCRLIVSTTCPECGTAIEAKE